MTDRGRGPRDRTGRPTDGTARPTAASENQTTTDTPMTRADRPDRPGAQTLKHVDHTHPDTDRTFGGNFTFARAGAVAADGGRPDVVPEDGAEPDDEEPETLEDVEHTPPNESDDANRVFVRGEEGPQPANEDWPPAAGEDGPGAADEAAPLSAEEGERVGDDERRAAHADSDDPEDE